MKRITLWYRFSFSKAVNLVISLGSSDNLFFDKSVTKKTTNLNWQHIFNNCQYVWSDDNRAKLTIKVYANKQLMTQCQYSMTRGGKGGHQKCDRLTTVNGVI